MVNGAEDTAVTPVADALSVRPATPTFRVLKTALPEGSVDAVFVPFRVPEEMARLIDPPDTGLPNLSAACTVTEPRELPIKVLSG